MEQSELIEQVRRVVKGKIFDFWLVNAKNDPQNLVEFLRRTQIPPGSEVFTSEGLYPGAALESLMRSECHNCENQKERDEAERAFLFEFARELQGRGSFNGTGIEIIELAKKKGIKLWLGAPFLESAPGSPDRLYNSYLLIEDGEIRFVHRKKFLWNGGGDETDSEIGVFELTGYDKRAPISLSLYDGIYENRAYLICQEADAFFSPKWRRAPTHIPEVRKARPDFVIVPARWLDRGGGKERYLRQIATGIARRIKDPVDRLSAVRKQGCLVLVINAYDIYICGPVNEKIVKARTYAHQPEKGWLRINNEGVTGGTF